MHEYLQRQIAEHGEIPKNASFTFILVHHIPQYYGEIAQACLGGDVVLSEFYREKTRQQDQDPEEAIDQAWVTIAAYNMYITGEEIPDAPGEITAMVEDPDRDNDMATAIVRALKGTQTQFLFADVGMDKEARKEMERSEANQVARREIFRESIASQPINEQVRALARLELASANVDRRRDVFVAGQAMHWAIALNKEWGGKPIDFRIVQGMDHWATPDLLEGAGGNVTRLYIPEGLAGKLTYSQEIQSAIFAEDKKPVARTLFERLLLEHYFHITGVISPPTLADILLSRSLIDTLNNDEVKQLLEELRSRIQKGRIGQFRAKRYAKDTVDYLRNRQGI